MEYEVKMMDPWGKQTVDGYMLNEWGLFLGSICAREQDDLKLRKNL
jgi:hypothetical protein